MEIDVPYLVGYLSYPESSLNSLLDAPTIELVKVLLERVASKAREHEQAQSENLKLNVELENAVRTAESKRRVLKGSVEKGLKEVADLRKKLQAEETSSQSLRSEVEALKSSTDTSTSEVFVLKSRIDSLESSNRNTLALLETKSTAFDDLVNEISTKQQKIIEHKKEISTLEQKVHSHDVASTNAKYREQSLEQEVERLKRNNDWLDQELSTQNTEHSKFRKDKGARVAELQRQNEESSTTIDDLRRTEQTLRTRLDEVNQKADDLLAQLQQMREDVLQQEENFRSELDTANRLAELMKSSVETERQRQQDLSTQLEKMQENALEEIGKINAEIRTEHHDRLAAERRVAELEVQLERIEADAALLGKSVRQPGSPARKANNSRSGTPGETESPSRMFSPDVSRIRGGLSFTQLYSQYHDTKAELEAEKKRNEKLAITIDEMIQDLEQRQPEVVELQSEHDRLEADVVEMSALVDSLGKERDQAKKDARKWEGQTIGMTRESDLLRQQLRDLSSQVKILLLELHGRQEGQDGFSSEERLKLENLARGNLDDSPGVTDSDRFISAQLATFKNISELQEQNTKLLKITRELSQKLEDDEAQQKKSQAFQNQEDLQNLRQKYERCRDEVKALLTQSQSYIRERDMFRRMLTHRGQLPPGSDIASMFGDSLDGGAPATPGQHRLSNHIESPQTSKDLVDYAKLLKEMQSHFDSYRQEAAIDRSTTKEQMDMLTNKNHDLRSELSRKVSEVTTASERYEMLQANYEMLKGENSELQKRSQALSERAAQQDIRTQQVAEDLVEAKGLLERLRTETANLKAEKDFRNTVEKRLTEDREHLVIERDRLNTLTISLQNLLNEREHSDIDSRRKLQSQLESAENELVYLKRKLSDETEEGKRMAERREYDNRHSQARIDDLVAGHASIREELVATKTGRDHLQARVDEMTVELRSVEENLRVLKPASSRKSNDDIAASEANTNDSVNKEQELAVEVSELKRDLDMAHRELTNAKAHMEQYKAISLSSEEELQSLNETQDQYRQEMDRVIEEKADKIKELEQTVEELRQKISDNASEISTTRNELARNAQKMDQQRDSLNSEITRLKDLHDRSQSAADYHLEDLKVQARIAQQAQQSYEDELVKHAEAAKTLQKLRTEQSQLKLEIVELKTQSESARISLTQSEESWAEARGQYEQEVADLRSRRNDANAQNNLLHQQLENINSQIAALQQRRTSTSDGGDGAPQPNTLDTQGLQDLIKYLRREKEIVEVQWELSSQEAKRLRQQLDHTQSQLDDVRLKLNSQRRAEDNSERNALNHNKLMQTINELNLNRESNVTLRLEKTEAQKSLAEQLKSVEELQQQIQPLQARVRELEDIGEGLEGDLRMAREARERFEQRYHDILNRSDNVDTAEHEALKVQVAALLTEKDELVSARQSLQDRLDTSDDTHKQSVDQANERFQESRNRMVQQFKDRSRELSGQIREKDTAINNITQTHEELQSQHRALQKDLETAKLARDEALAACAVAQAEKKQTPTRGGSEEGQINDGASGRVDSDNLQEKLDAALLRVEQEAAESARIQALLGDARARISELEAEVAALKGSLSEAEANMAEIQARQQVQQQTQVAPPLPVESGEQIEQLRVDLAKALEDVEALRTASAINVSADAVQAQEGSISVADQITAQVDAIRAELTARHDQRIHQADIQYKERTEKMRSQLSKKLSEGKAAVAKDHTQALEDLKLQHQKDIDMLVTRHQDELNELQRNEENRFEEYKQSLLAERDSLTANGDSKDANAPQTVRGPWEPTEDEIKELVAKNAVVKGIIQRNIVNRVNKERDILSAKILEEQRTILNEKLSEAENRREQAVQQAVQLEGKRVSVKMSMTESRARTAQAKIDLIQKTAQETPEKPVGEVWTVVKTVKALQVGPTQSPGSSIPQLQPAAMTSQHQAPVQNPFPVLNNPIRPAPALFGQPSTLQPQDSPVTVKIDGPGLGNAGLPSVEQAPSEPQRAAPTPSDISPVTQAPVPAVSSVPDNPFQPNMQPNMQPTARLADKGPLGQSSNHHFRSMGTGPAALRNLQQQSSLPLPSAPRGSGQFPAQSGRGAQHFGRGGGGRGRGGGGGGGGRGDIPPVQTQNVPQGPQGGSSPRGGGPPLSATARQFVPQGTKRAREVVNGLDGSIFAGDINNGGKRMRGDRGGHTG